MDGDGRNATVGYVKRFNDDRKYQSYLRDLIEKTSIRRGSKGDKFSHTRDEIGYDIHKMQM